MRKHHPLLFTIGWTEEVLFHLDAAIFPLFFQWFMCRVERFLLPMYTEVGANRSISKERQAGAHELLVRRSQRLTELYQAEREQ